MPPAIKTPPAYTVAPALDGFVIRRDDAMLKTHAGVPLTLPNKKLAEAIADEFRGQPEKIDLAAMPLMQLAVMTIDSVAAGRGPFVNHLTAYAESELLCHRALHPPALVEEQQKTWQPILDWCTEQLDAPLRLGTGVMPIEQPKESLHALQKAIMACDDFHLAGLNQAVVTSGSLVLGLALARRHLAAAQIFEAAELEGSFQIKQWGEDPAAQNRRETMRRDLGTCERWFNLLG